LNEVYGTKEEVLGLGIGVPGPVNSKTGIVSKLMHIPGFEDFQLKEKLHKLIDIDTKIENDANLAALGELHFGSGKNYSDIIFITVGTGIGGGIITNGQLVIGKSGGGGEIGCMKIGNSGKYCACGQFDCWHAYCSSAALVREAKVRLCLTKENLVWELCGMDFKKLEAKHIFDAAKKNDYFAKQLVDYEVKYLAKGIGSLINIFDPEAIIMGGGMSHAGDILFKPLKEEIRYHARPKAYENLNLIPSDLGNKAGMLGAIALFLN